MLAGSGVILPLFLAALAALVLAGVVHRWAVARSLLDYPTERSSHAVPTPRGGGVAIVVVVLATIVMLAFFGRLDWRTTIGIGGGGTAIALIGWLDDVRPSPAPRRLVIHFLSAAWVVSWLGGFPTLNTGAVTIHLGSLGGVLATIGVVWATNLFNFMDGIDGLAAIEAMSIGIVGGAFLVAAGSPSLATISFVVAGAAAGFLRWNWAPARLFMGDVGSGFLGFIFAALAIASENERAVAMLVWSILGATFILDATVTFFRRLRAGLWQSPHRTHAYQRAVQFGFSHAQVSLAVGGFNALLGLIGLIAMVSDRLMIPAVVMAFLMIGAVYLAVERRRPFMIESVPARGSSYES